jgi:hypothetical protein
MAFEKYRQLIDELLSKTDQGRLQWQETAEPGSFQVSFPNYSVIISQESNPPLPQNWRYRLRILNAEGRGVDWFSDYDLGDDYKARMADLYERARRQALGAEKAIDEILDVLKAAF